MIQELTVYVDNLPPGAIIMWFGDQKYIPQGWAICDGNFGTPDLTDRFIIGAGKNYEVKQKGGQDKITLTIENMPEHNHGGKTQEEGKHKHRFKLNTAEYKAEYSRRQVVEPYASNFSHDTDESGNHKHGITSEGKGVPYNNLPPYYALLFIMKKSN